MHGEKKSKANYAGVPSYHVYQNVVISTMKGIRGEKAGNKRKSCKHTTFITHFLTPPRVVHNNIYTFNN